MKRFSLLIFMLLSFYVLEAQYVDRTNFRAGINGGLVVGDFSEAYSFALGADIYHFWGVSRAMDLGVATGFFNAFGETQEFSESGFDFEVEFENFQFIPVAGALRVYPAAGFKIGADLGYALGINQGNDGGFYYRPSIGFDMSEGSKEFNISYAAVGSEEATYSSILASFLILF